MRKSLDEFFKPYFARHQFDGSGIMDTTICLPDIAIVTVVLGELAWKESFNEDSCIFFGFVSREICFFCSNSHGIQRKF
eukprot:CCRYP_001411-RD/>CCRYP_001411-RD protein AED:0.48 eAED:0.65 QI:0/0/0/1/0/0/2/0/78